MGIAVFNKDAARSPWQNVTLSGSLDRFVANASTISSGSCWTHLRRVLNAYGLYCNEARAHLAGCGRIGLPTRAATGNTAALPIPGAASSLRQGFEPCVVIGAISRVADCSEASRDSLDADYFHLDVFTACFLSWVYHLLRACLLSSRFRHRRQRFPAPADRC